MGKCENAATLAFSHKSTTITMLRPINSTQGWIFLLHTSLYTFKGPKRHSPSILTLLICIFAPLHRLPRAPNELITP